MPFHVLCQSSYLKFCNIKYRILKRQILTLLLVLSRLWSPRGQICISVRKALKTIKIRKLIRKDEYKPKFQVLFESFEKFRIQQCLKWIKIGVKPKSSFLDTALVFSWAVKCCVINWVLSHHLNIFDKHFTSFLSLSFHKGSTFLWGPRSEDLYFLMI